ADIRATVALELASGVTVDVRSGGRSQIAAAPSTHASGTTYIWRRELPEDLTELPELPSEWLARLVERPRTTGSRANGGKVHEGGRNQYLFKHGCGLRARGRGEAEIREELRAENERHCGPPLSTDEVDATVESIMRYAAGGEPKEQPRAEGSRGAESVAFTGKRLTALLDRPAPPPIYSAIPAPGHLTLLVAPALTGKTSLSCKLALARAAGVAPWTGAPVLER